MNRELYFDSQYGIETYALCEDGKIVDFCAEKSAGGAVIGNIYKGRVTNVLNGMQAAFVDCGLDKHCYISAADLIPDRIKPDVSEMDIPRTLDLHEGDEILVQVTKAAQGKKGAKVTTRLSFVGKYIIYMPNTPFFGVSAKITDAELRKNLTYSAKQSVNGDEGLIVRTAAPYAVISTKRNEIERFRKLYKSICERFANAPVGELLFSDSTLHIRVLRDIIFSGGEKIYVGNRAVYNEVKELISSACEDRDRVEVIEHDPHTDLFYTHGVYEQYAQSLTPKVELQNGAYLIIEQTEALTVIDVNTGKFTGEDSLEHTVYCTNILAAHEIARQVKLRNLGGIFVVDFIDMQEENHREAIVEELEKALRADKSKCRVLPMSRFGLVEFTRKRTGVSASELMLRTCDACGGAGVIRTRENILAEFRARLLGELADGASAVCADLNFSVANQLLGYEALKANLAALYPQARVYIIAHRTYREENMYFRKINSTGFTLPEGTVLLY